MSQVAVRISYTHIHAPPHNTHETSFLGDSDDRTLGTTAVWNGLARCSGSDARLHRLRCCDLTVKSTELELTS